MKASAKTIGKLLVVMLYTTFGMGNAKAQTKTKTETVELKTANPDILVKVIREGKILETKAFNNSSSKSFELSYSVNITLKSKTRTFTKTLKSGATAMLPLKPNSSTFSKSELLSSADDEVKYIDGTQIKAPQDPSLYNALISAELVSFAAKEVKQKAEDLANKQKPATPQKKTTVTTTTKATHDEAILVTPKPKVAESKNALLKLSSKDQEIIELGKKNTIKIKNIRDYDGNGYGWFGIEKVYITEPIDRIYYTENGNDIILKDIKLKDYGYSYRVDNKLDENGNFCIEYTGYVPGKGTIDGRWSDIITIKGESLLSDKTIDKITYKENGIYELQKRGDKQPKEQYNFKTKKISSLQ